MSSSASRLAVHLAKRDHFSIHPTVHHCAGLLHIHKPVCSRLWPPVQSKSQQNASSCVWACPCVPGVDSASNDSKDSNSIRLIKSVMRTAQNTDPCQEPPFLVFLAEMGVNGHGRAVVEMGGLPSATLWKLT